LAEQPISLEISKWERRENSYRGDYETYLELELVTDPEGRVTEYLDLESGRYRIEASAEDDRENLLKKRRYVYILGEDTDLSENFIDGITLSSTRTEYTAGETAEVMIETAFAGEGLLTIERGGVLDYRVVRVEPPYTIIDVPLYGSYAPNVYVYFQIWEEVDVMSIEMYGSYSFTSTGESKLRSDYIKLEVLDVSHQLQVEISSDKEVYQPGEEATFYIEVNDAAGNPVNTEVSLALVDEAIYLLSQDLVDPIHEAFFSPRELGVGSFNSLVPTRENRPPGRGGGGGGGDFSEDGADPRSDFPDTLIWLPRLITEEDGRLRVTVTLPDSLTTWRVSVKGVTLDTEVGEAVHTVITQQPVVVRPQLPQQLIVGDTFVLSAVVHNYTAEALNFVAYADCSICDFTGDLSHRVAVEPGESEVVNWQADVVEAGESDVVISVEAGEYGDAVQTTVTAAPRSISSWVSESGSFEGKVEIPIDLPDDALPGSQLVIKLDRTISSSLLDGVEYLTGFPYGCIEQTMSRALPNAVVSRAFNQLGVSERAGLADLDAKIQASIQRLYAFQHDDGGWGWWYDDSSNNYNTAWVVFGLQVTAESGYFIDPGVIERGTSYLAENLAEMNADTQSFALYAMSLGGGAELDDVLSLTSSFVDLNTFSQSALILTLDQLGEEELALELLLSIVDDLETDSLGRQYIPGRSKDGYYDKKYMSSSVRSNALLLKAILTVHPDHGSASGIADWLMSKRRSNSGWGTTNETAFSMIALTDYIAHEQTAGKVFTYSISLNGTEYSTAQFAAGENSEVINIPAAKLAEGENQVVITSDSAQALYYVVGRELVSETLPEDVEGIMVKRTYHHPETKKELTTFSEGDLVMIQITVNIPTDAFYIIIEDPLPGGLIALNENLALTSHAASADPYAAATRYRWHILGYNYKEIYPDKVVFFITELADGYYTYQYYARAVVAGEFISPPTHLSAMYDEDFYGYGEEIILEVQD
ncbi:MAG: alpha-2-macroglobulin family protein, partial [Chloroflexota bacterium]